MTPSSADTSYNKLHKFLSTLDFAPFHKIGLCSPKHEVLSDYLVSYEGRDPWLSIGLKISWKYLISDYLRRPFQSVNMFSDALCIPSSFKVSNISNWHKSDYELCNYRVQNTNYHNSCKTCTMSYKYLVCIISIAYFDISYLLSTYSGYLFMFTMHLQQTTICIDFQSTTVKHGTADTAWTREWLVARSHESRCSWLRNQSPSQSDKNWVRIPLECVCPYSSHTGILIPSNFICKSLKSTQMDVVIMGTRQEFKTQL